MNEFREYVNRLNRIFKEAGLDYKIELGESKVDFQKMSRGAQLAELYEQAPLGFKI